MQGNGNSIQHANVIKVRGARVHNLKNVDVDIPRHKLVVITGPSGSGKSSLAFDTLFAEGQRQYIESLSVYARQFLHQLERPDVDLIEGLQPTVCIDQRPGNRNPRSTVATVTEIYDYLRVLISRVGQPACYACGEPIRQQTAEQIQETLLRLPDGTKAMIFAPLVRGRRGQHADAIARIRKAGFVRARIDAEIHDIDNVPALDIRKEHTIEAVVDRIVIRPNTSSRLAESLSLALRHGDGLVAVCYLDEAAADTDHPKGVWRDELFSTLYACPTCGVNYEELEPRTFSFNSAHGACPACEGLGVLERFDPETVVPDRTLSLAGGAVLPWKGGTKAADRKHRAALEPFLESVQLDFETPLSEFSDAAFEQFLHGDGETFLGLMTLLEKELSTATSRSRQEHLNRFRGTVVCRSCGGSRLRPEANSVRLAGKTICEVTRETVASACRFFAKLPLAPHEQDIGGPLVEEIRRRLDFLERVGLSYLTLDRAADTLSGGEMQRVRLATCIGSGLVGACYILDEPSIGLHPRDNDQLIDSLRRLQEPGNSIVVVEHDEAMMRAADWVIDFGPHAGQHGGQIVSQGTPADLTNDPSSLTGRYLSGAEAIPHPSQRRKVAKTRCLTLHGARANNLKNVDVQFPLGVFVCVTGVSGSGKSTLVNETLAPALIRRLGGVAQRPGEFASLRGASQIDKVIRIDQSPIGRSPRSNAATYTGVFDEVRKVFAKTRDARQRGFKANRFSFNVKGGRCEHCQGQGLQKIEMNFLADIYVTCSECDGSRFNRQTLEVRFRDKSIADVLEMPVDTALEFFASFAHIARFLQSLSDVGLGYLTLGQPSTTLSGGEAQRIKLATELARVETGSTLYLLDEPTTGLHFDDIRRLLSVLNALVDRGNTVVVIEHNLDVMRAADWIIDLGPEGGDAGGQVVAQGTPDEIGRITASHTGRFLRQDA